MSATTPTDPELQKQTLTVTIDGQPLEAQPGELLIAAAERTGTYIPRFCYHPRMKPVGMCRMCLVNVDGPRGPSLQVSCMLTCNDGMQVDTKAPEVKKAQDGVLEFLLVNHPLDCPVCDKGGECPLQDQTLTFGPGETRFVEEKRHFEKPIEISPLVKLDRERCILCDRCTRFSNEVAGDPLISFQGRGNMTQVNVAPGHPFSSYFSGNTVQICPVGALTATPYRFKARPWDLEQVESTCTSCSVGCRVAVQSSGDALTRYLGVDSDPVNHGWLCDKGRFDFEAVNSEARLRSPARRDEAGLSTEVSWADALAEVATAIRQTAPERVGFIGGARLPNEDQYAWAKLAKGVVGTDNVDAQLGDGLAAEVVLGLPRATIDEACSASAIVLVGPDLKEELPVLYLRLRTAVLDRGVPLIEIASQPTSATALASHCLTVRPGEEAAVAAGLLGRAKGIEGVDSNALAAAHRTLTEAGASGNVVVVFGRPSMAESGRGVAEAVGLFAAHSNARFLPALRRSNVHGALDMGLAPGVLPGRVGLEGARRWYEQVWSTLPAKRGLDTVAMLAAAAAGEIDVLVLLGADPLADVADRTLATEALNRVATVVVIDTLPTASVAAASVALPAAAYGERPGTTTNIEGRVSKLGQKVTPPGVAWPDWMIAAELAQHLGADLGFETLASIWAEIEALAPSHRGLTTAVLNDRRNRDGVVVGAAPVQTGSGGPIPFIAPDAGSGASTSAPALDPAAWPGIGDAEWHDDPAVSLAMGDSDVGVGVVPRPTGATPPPLRHATTDLGPLPTVDGYALRLVSGRKLYDRGTALQHSPNLAGLVRPEALRVHPSVLAPLGIESGGQVRVRNARGSLVLSVVADAAVHRNAAVLPWHLEEIGPADLIDANELVTNVRIETP